MNHVISFSTGLSSAVAVERVLQRYDNNVFIIAMDTKMEDPDNWRFSDECKTRWKKEIVILADGRTPRQVAEDKQIIPNQKIAPCTFELKINPFCNWMKAQKFRSGVTIHIGYDIFEAHRCEQTRKNYESQGWLVDFPLLWKPLEHRSYSQVVRDDWGIEPPRTYAMGFSHANCLNQLCFKTSIADAVRFLINFPDRYQEQENWEQKMRNHPKRKNYAILRDQSNRDVKPLTLRELRLRHEKEIDRQPMLFNFDQQISGCVSCGIGDFIYDHFNQNR